MEPVFEEANLSHLQEFGSTTYLAGMTKQETDLLTDGIIPNAPSRNEEVRSWLNPEFQQVQARRADLLGVTSSGGLVHIELQSTHDGDMPLRMAEYAIAAYRQFSQLPTQIVLYVGEAPLRMVNVLRGPDPTDPDFAFRFSLVDFRDLDGGLLLNSDCVEDNVLAILTRLLDRRAVARSRTQGSSPYGRRRTGRDVPLHHLAAPLSSILPTRTG